MTSRNDPQDSSATGDADLLLQLAARADRMLIKKLSNNDRDWARFANKHQAGLYVPHEQRDGGFFPQLAVKERQDEDAKAIREVFLQTIWPQLDNEQRRSRLVHYTSKGQETHLTGLPKVAFGDLLPASWIVIGRLDSGAYECITIDSGSDEAALLRQVFELDAEFLIGEFDPAALRARERDKILDFAEQAIRAWLAGKIAQFAIDNAAMPSTAELARMARQQFLAKYGLASLDPFSLPAPGDALYEISRDIEWSLFQDYQRRERSVQLVRTALGDEPKEFNAKDVIRSLIDQFAGIDALMLSAAQQRKSRAGYSYEHHIEAMLQDGGVPFEKQVIVEAKKRPDFILPSLSFVDSGREDAKSGLILSAKTTLRERWKQVEREMGRRRLFLTTVDENIAGNAIEDMASIGVCLVVPERLIKSSETEYAGHDNVVSFKDFCFRDVKPNLGVWGADKLI